MSASSQGSWCLTGLFSATDADHLLNITVRFNRAWPLRLFGRRSHLWDLPKRPYVASNLALSVVAACSAVTPFDMRIIWMTIPKANLASTVFESSSKFAPAAVRLTAGIAFRISLMLSLRCWLAADRGLERLILKESKPFPQLLWSPHRAADHSY